MMDKNSLKVIPKECGHGDPLVRVLPAKSQTWRGDKTNRQFKIKTFSTRNLGKLKVKVCTRPITIDNKGSNDQIFFASSMTCEHNPSNSYKSTTHIFHSMPLSLNAFTEYYSCVTNRLPPIT